MHSRARRSSVQSARSSRQMRSTIWWAIWEIRSSEIFITSSQYDLPLFCQPVLDHPEHLAPVDIDGSTPQAGNGLIQQTLGITLQGLFTAHILGDGFGNPLDHRSPLAARCDQTGSGQVVIHLLGQALNLFFL